MNMRKGIFDIKVRTARLKGMLIQRDQRKPRRLEVVGVTD